MLRNSHALKQACRMCLRKYSSDTAPSTPDMRGARSVLTGERGINRVTLLGRAGQDSSVRGSMDNPVTVFPLATSYTLKTVDGEYVQKTEWHRISIFRPVLRDIVSQNVKKGDRVLVQGSISYSQYKDKNNVIQRATNIIADDVLNISRTSSSAAMMEPPPMKDDFAEEELPKMEVAGKK